MKLNLIKLNKAEYLNIFLILFLHIISEKKIRNCQITLFKYLLKKNNLDFSNCIHIGDNPYRDFINIKQIGIFILRIIRNDGTYTIAELPKKYEANNKIYSLDELFNYI